MLPILVEIAVALFRVYTSGLLQIATGARPMGVLHTWKKGRGRLGLLTPLLGNWIANGDSQLGSYVCRRSFRLALDNTCVVLDAHWSLPNKEYLEHAILCPNDDGLLAFWSFTSDGKRLQGELADARDIHANAVAFIAKTPGGLARMAYWPAAETGFHWAVEAQNKTGWKRFTEHHYLAAS